MDRDRPVPALSTIQRPLRVAIVLPSHWLYMMGGSQYQVKLLIDALYERGLVEIKYFAARVGEQTEFGNHVVGRTGTVGSLRRYGHFWDYFSLQRALREFQPDVVYQRVRCSLTGIAARYAKRSGIPMIWHACVDNDVTFVNDRIIHWLRNPQRGLERAMGRYGMMAADYVIVQTQDQRNMLRGNYGIEAHSVIPNFHPVPGECNSKEAEITVVWIANLKRVKRPELFLEVARRLIELDGLRFIIIGACYSDRRQQKVFEESVAELRNTEYLGYLSQEEVNAILEGAHILVNTSLVEGFANTFIQAWMRRVPVLTLGVNPDKLLDSGELGKCCATLAELTDTLRDLANNPDSLRVMGAMCRKKSIELFSMRNVELLADLIIKVGTRAAGGYRDKPKQAPLRRVSRRVFSLLNDAETEKYFVSFPKSGRTWVRMFLNHYYFYIYPFCVVGRNQSVYRRKIPSIKFSHGGHEDYGAASMSDMERAVANVRRESTIVLLRDPRDVLISYFFHLTKRIPESGSQNNINVFSDIIRHETLGFGRIIEFMNLWYAFAANNRNALVVHYEDIKQSTETQFIRILNFLGDEEVNRESLRKAIVNTSFENMQKAERKAESKLPYLISADVHDEDSFKVRKGVVGGYVSYLTEAQREFLNEQMDKLHPVLRSYYLGAREETGLERGLG